MATCPTNQVTARPGRPAVPGGGPILPSKITAPGVPDWALARPRITNLVARGTRWCPLTVVTGPVGAGKTMALTLWAAAQAGPVAWLCLDEYDNRPGVLWANLVAALRQSGIALPKALSPAARGRTAEHVFLLRLASALAALDPPVTLVLDEFDLLTEPRALAGLDFVLRNVGPGLHLVACSRSDPLLPLHRYRLAGQLTEIRAADLAFTTAEAAQLLGQHGCTLPAGSLKVLMARTEGWAAGLRLAAMSLAGHPDPDQFVTDLATEHSPLASYLVREVLDAQPPEVRELLLITSILEPVTPGAAGELTGHDRAGQILAGLAHTNCFVRPTGAGQYRYHSLFAEVLRLTLRSEHPERVTKLHHRAAGWYQRHGALTEAVRHTAHAGDWQAAASLIIDELAVGEILDPEPGQALAQQFASMPPQQACATPQLRLISAAAALAAGAPEAATAALDSAEKDLEQLPAEQATTSQLAASLIRLAAARRTGNPTAAAAAAATAETLVGHLPPDTLARHPHILAQVRYGRGAAALWAGDVDQAAHLLESGAGAMAVPGGDRVRADCLGYLALVEALRGHPGRATQLAAQATGPLTPGDQHPPAHRPIPAALAALAWAHLDRNELPEAGTLLKQTNAALRSRPDTLVDAVACLAAARGYLADHRPALAEQYLARARSEWSVPAWLEQKLHTAKPPPAAAPARSQQHPSAPPQRERHPAPLSPSAKAAGPLIIEPLTAREQEVLRRLSDMLSTAEVATEMYISINTVKAHVKSILRKLAAAHRGEAVRRARQLGLI